MARDKEEQKSYSAAYYAANKEKINTKNATYRATNKEKARAYRATYYAANKEKTKAYNRLRNTGVTQEQYDGAYLKQKGVCAICSGVEASGRELSADHCHTTGVFRGLLCTQCNLGLGKFKDNKLLLENAIQYLKDSNDTKDL